MSRLLSKYTNLKLFLLDDRAFDPTISRIERLPEDRIIFLPDPGPTVQCNQKRKSEPYIKVLIVGLQSKRKGINEIFELLKLHGNELTNVKFLLAGRFDKETDFLIKNIAKYNGQLEYHEGFFSEIKIKEFYENTDYVILPYEKSFSGSSGVLAYSTAFGKPVVATSHGCVGYRTTSSNIGYVYESGRIADLKNLIRKLPAASTAEYRKLSENCKRFAEKRSISAHQRTIFENL
jgi:glycosyltransferase involved in cell wall biosynthesis